MIAVIFEAWPTNGRKADYLDHAARLRVELEHVDGFISVERFQSLADPDKLLSVSLWRDEAAVAIEKLHEPMALGAGIARDVLHHRRVDRDVPVAGEGLG